MEFVEQPISDAQAENFYESIFEGLGGGTKPLFEACDSELTHTRRWCGNKGIDFALMRAWIESRGGFCDCEVLFNVMPDDKEEESP